MNKAFDRIASWVADIVSRAPFFLFCVLLIVIWVPSFPLFSSPEAWQLPINTITTIITFLLVALLQNTERRTEGALTRKLDAIADALADLMFHTGEATGRDIDRDIKELREAAQVEMEETAPRAKR
jgi:low affinity Fe/Cu permease